MVKNLPALGFNTWNTFGENINEQLVRDTADAMAATGLRDAGYTYLVIDDCWAEKERDDSHRLVPSHETVPSGMKALADYVHSKGLKFGMYSCAGNQTCAGYPSSFEYEFIDAATFASWGVDFLKYDFCNRPAHVPGHILYKRMGAALANCGRDILFSACSWGAEDTKSWIKTTGAGMWRSTGDIVDNWESIKSLFNQQVDIQAYNGTGCFNDMDMLVVGMDGAGNVGMGGCTFEEYRTHFTLWAMLNSPLMIGCDVRNIRQESLDILTNADVLAVNQDPACRQPYIISGGADTPVIVKLLEGGDFAIGMFNMTDEVRGPQFTLADMGLGRVCGKTLEMRELWSGKTAAPQDYLYREVIQPHDCRIFRARVVDAR